MTEKENKKAGSAADADAAATADAAPTPTPAMEGEEFDLFEEFELPGGERDFFLRARIDAKGPGGRGRLTSLVFTHPPRA
jgi:hypothetical protein